MAGSPEDALLAYTGEADLGLAVAVFVVDPRDADGKKNLRPVELKLAVGPGRRPADPPSVSCLMVTRDRFELARLSIGCFRRQSWPRKELVVLDESADDRLRNWIASLADPRIRVFRVSPGATLGELRNRATDLATGDFVCQWDDDDLQHPARLEIAFAVMAATRTSASLLAHEMIWMPLRMRLGISTARPRPHENTLLARRDVAPRYPALARGEDTPAIDRVLATQPAVLIALPQLYMYVVHGQNTWDADHSEGIWQASAVRTEGAETEARLARFAAGFPVREYAAALSLPSAAPTSAGGATAVSSSRLLDYKGGADAMFSVAGFIARAEPEQPYHLRTATLNLRLGPSPMRGPLPFVSCLMVTRDRFELARISVDCFRRQTWLKRELVVLDSSQDNRLRDWIAALGDPSIRWVSSRGSQDSLGALRNRSIELAEGDMLCIWDDDDLHHPARIEVAMAAMAATRLPICLLAREMLWMVADRRIGVLARDPWPQEATLVVARSAGLRYPALDRAEDTPAIRELMQRHQAVLLDAPELYVYAIHGRNTWDHAHLERLWSLTADRSEGPGLAARLSELGHAYPMSDYADAVRARNAALGAAVSQSVA